VPESDVGNKGSLKTDAHGRAHRPITPSRKPKPGTTHSTLSVVGVTFLRRASFIHCGPCRRAGGRDPAHRRIGALLGDRKCSATGSKAAAMIVHKPAISKRWSITASSIRNGSGSRAFSPARDDDVQRLRYLVAMPGKSFGRRTALLVSQPVCRFQSRSSKKSWDAALRAWQGEDHGYARGGGIVEQAQKCSRKRRGPRDRRRRAKPARGCSGSLIYTVRVPAARSHSRAQRTRAADAAGDRGD